MSSFTASDGRRLAYADTGGDRPAVLCLAGLSRNGRDFDELSAHLAPRYRVLRLDSRGRGGSERAVDPFSEYSVAIEAADAIALLDHLRLDRVALIGTSRGGILSMAIAGAQRERVSAVVLNDVGAVIDGRGLLRILATLGRQPTARDFEEAAADLRAMNEAEFPGVSDEAWLRHAHRLYDDVDGRPVLAYDPKLRFAVAGAIEEGGPQIALWPLFESLERIPTLVIRGENSDILSAKTVEAMRATRSDLRTVTLRDRGHAPFLDEPEVLRAIDELLDAALLEHATIDGH